ncbi:MAG: hypothetical protein Q8865_08425 [Bacillota bacterium]|nr:hypothetical protein [Bacillota bacterium]
MKRYKIASLLMIFHGAFMELGGCLMLVPLLFFANDDTDINRYFSFIVPYLQDHLCLIALIGGIFGILRIIGAIGLFKNRMWGLVLSVINCVITLALMAFMLPAGIADGILAGTALLLILTEYYGKAKIVDGDEQ